MRKIKSNSTKETLKIGEKIGKLLNRGDIICLIGELGCGKTTLIKGITKGVDVASYVHSPTFIIVLKYEGKFPVYHIDLYRIENVQDAVDFGIEEYLKGDGITLIEWAEKIESLLPQEYLLIKLKLKTKNCRILEFIPKGERFVKLVKKLR